MSRGFQHETGKIGWMIPTAMQLVPVVLLLGGLPFIPGEFFSYTHPRFASRLFSVSSKLTT
jgi:hypothetical protein